MQQPITARDVYTPTVKAMVGNDEIDVSSVSVDRELPDPVSGGSFTAATGGLAATVGDDVALRVPTPWDPASSWPPAPETAVSVSMDVGDGPVSVMAAGRVTSASGNSGGREVSVEFADMYRTLDRSISWDAVADAMPSRVEGTTARYVGMVSTAVTDRILRHCGWYSTPPQADYCVVSVPAQGTMWPERGQCLLAKSFASAGAYPGFVTAPWGVCATDVDAAYGPSVSYSVAERGGFEIVAMAGNPDGSSMVIEVIFGSHVFRLTWTDSWFYAYAPNGSGAQTVVASAPRAGGLVTARFNRATSTSVSATVTSSAGSGSGSLAVPSGSLTTALDRVRIAGYGRTGGLQVAFPTTASNMSSWVPNAVINARPSNRNSLRVLPSVAGENCAELLGDQCAAENATYWIDETGVLQWWDLSRLDSQPSQGELTSADHITESGFSWSHDYSAVKSGVVVKWQEPLRAWSWHSNVTLHQGGGGSVSETEGNSEEWVNVPDDEIWIMPDTSMSQAGYESTMSDYNYGRGSFFGGVVGENEAWAWDLSGSLERVNDTTFKLVHNWPGPGDVTLKGVSTRTIDPNLWSARLGLELPVIRGRAKFTLAEMVTASTITGPKSSPEHEIDVGWWIQRTDQASTTANYAAERLTIPQPVLSSVSLVPVPGLQLGDVVNVNDAHMTRLLISGVVVADSRAVEADGGIDQTVTIRPLTVSVDGITWLEWGHVVRGDRWHEWGEAQTGKTWTDWGSAPLDGEI